MTAPRVITEPLGGSALVRAALHGRAGDWFPERPSGASAWRRYVAGVAERHRDGTWFRALAPGIAAEGVAAARLERVARMGGVVVSTGQQAGLFGGPMYTLVKALSALAFADMLERTTGVATSTVFWGATDDADYEEACWAAIAVTGGVRTLRLPPAARPGVPMSRMPMPDVEQLTEELLAASGAVIEPSVLELVRECYTSSETLGGAYVRLLRGILQPLGIAVLDASHPAVRRAAAPVLQRALERATLVEGALRARYDAIRAAGHDPQVEHLQDLSLVFEESADGAKQRIPVREAARHAPVSPDTLSPNVLLRPIVERFIMPSAAYVAGPGELAYFAQVGAAADALELPRPLPLPRWSVTIVEPRIERLLTRLGVERDELRDPHAVEARLARAALPATLSDALRSLRRDLERDIGAVKAADSNGLVPAASVEGVRRWVLHRIERLERRYVAAVKRREGQIMQDVATARGALFPDGQPQERVLNFIPFLARYGTALVDAMRRQAEQHAAAIVQAEDAPLGADIPVPERV